MANARTTFPPSSPAASSSGCRSPASREVLSLLRELNRKDGHTIVLVTHDPDAASKAGRVVFLRDGKIAGEITGGSTKRVSERFAALG